MRDRGLEQAIAAAGGVSHLARALGVSQPTVSNWRRAPAERVLAIEIATGVSRSVLRPDLYPEGVDAAEAPLIDEVDAARAAEYRLLAALMARAPKRALIEKVARLQGDATPLGLAHVELAEAAARIGEDTVDREYFDLFIGVGRGEFLPFGSYYMAGFLNDRPLARLREDMARIGIERAEAVGDPEDHIAFLCEMMAGMADGTFEADIAEQGRFFARHIKPWGTRFFADVEASQRANFYRAVGRVGRVFLEIEDEAFSLGEKQ